MNDFITHRTQNQSLHEGIFTQKEINFLDIFFKNHTLGLSQRHSQSCPSLPLLLCQERRRDYIKYTIPKTKTSNLEWWAAWGIIPKNGGWEGLLEIYIERLG